uniref:Uncharacterized protein n=1 Tax=Panagrolaimus sp. ES5 TaxID=591445 RepID=A0AC34FB00_9BILA
MLCFLAIIVLVNAFSKNANHSTTLPELFQEYKDVLPPNLMEEINQVRKNTSLKRAQKYDKIDKIILSAPESILDKLPLPQGFTELPVDVQQKLQSIRRNATLTWEEKQKMYKTLIKSLPEQFRHLIMPAFGGKSHGSNCASCGWLCFC